MNFLMNNKKLVILLTVILSVLVGLATVRLRMDSSISSVLPTGDADYQYNNRISEDFGNSQEIIILLTSPSSVYTEGNLNLIQNITLYLKQKKEIQTEGVASRLSIPKRKSRWCGHRSRSRQPTTNSPRPFSSPK